MTDRRLLRSRPRSRSAFSLLEVSISAVITAVLLVAAMRTLGASLRSGLETSDRSRADLLAQDMMVEILSMAYVEPTEIVAFGPEASETGGTRALFDDVDDFHNWDESPPTYPDGTVIPNFTAWRRTVVVQDVMVSDLTQLASPAEGVKRITVDVKRNGVTIATLTAARSDSDY